MSGHGSRRATEDENVVGRTPWSARVPLDPLCVRRSRPRAACEEAGRGAGRGPGGPPHHFRGSRGGKEGSESAAPMRVFTSLEIDMNENSIRSKLVPFAVATLTFLLPGLTFGQSISAAAAQQINDILADKRQFSAA